MHAPPKPNPRRAALRAEARLWKRATTIIVLSLLAAFLSASLLFESRIGPTQGSPAMMTRDQRDMWRFETTLRGVLALLAACGLSGRFLDAILWTVIATSACVIAAVIFLLHRKARLSSAMQRFQDPV